MNLKLLFHKPKRVFLVFIFSNLSFTQNSLVGDGFGGRLWYKPTNYSSGSYSGFAICEDSETNQLFGWGSNMYGELGLDMTSVSGTLVPVAIPNMTNVKIYSAGYVMGAIKNDNSGWAWGSFLSGGAFSEPTQVLLDAKFVDAGMEFISFVKNDGTVWSLGYNSFLNFGNGTATNSLFTPVQMNGITNAVRVACSYSATYILLSDGTVKIAGTVSNGLGVIDPSLTSTDTPLVMNLPSNIVDIKASSIGVMALRNNGEVYLAGQHIPIPIQILGIDNAVAISGMCDGVEFLILTEDKKCYSIIPFPGVTSATMVATDVIDILAGETFSYIIKSDGNLYGKGESNWGSIWLSLPNIERTEYTLINIKETPELCPIKMDKIVKKDCGSIEVVMANGVPPYLYNIGNGDQISNEFSELVVGSYTVVVTDAIGAQTFLDVNITSSYVNIDATIITDLDDDYIDIGSTYNFSNGSGYNLGWYYCDSLISTAQNVTYSFNDLESCCIELKATISDCVDSTNLCFSVINTSIHLPNIFTPNDDGLNDFFKIDTENVDFIKCVILNRWGESVHEWSGINGSWDGKINGKNASEGVYFYNVIFSFLGQEIQNQHGFFNLER